MTWRIEVRDPEAQYNPFTGKWEAFLAGPSLVAVWEGPGEPPERKPDEVKLHLREPAPVPYLDN